MYLCSSLNKIIKEDQPWIVVLQTVETSPQLSRHLFNSFYNDLGPTWLSLQSTELQVMSLSPGKVKLVVKIVSTC